MTITLYHVPRTISSPIVQVLLEMGLVNDPVVVHQMAFADLKSEAHLAINPMGTSPALVDTEIGVRMWESGAVLDYLLERYDPGHRLHPAPASDDPERASARAKYLQLKQYVIATVYPFIASLYLHTLKDLADQDAEYVSAALLKCRTVLGPVLADFLGDSEYLLGESVSAVDFLIAKPLGNARQLGWLGEFPTLSALFDRVSSRPTYEPAYGNLLARTPALAVGEQGHRQTIVLVPSQENHVQQQQESEGKLIDQM